MNSMTGYGGGEGKTRQLEVEAHVKSVNGRYLEVRFHLPKEYAPFENDFRKLFSSWSRGTVDVYVNRRPAIETKLQTVKVRRQNAQYWAKELQALAKSLKLKSDLTVRDILQMPYVMEHQDRLSLLPGEMQLAKKVIQGAMKKCEAVRASEGVVLKKELISQIRQLEAKIGHMEACREDAIKSASGRLKSRLAAVEAGEGVDPSRLALETALIIDKMDVHEEVVRLKEHVKACLELIQASDAKGKKLDFYCQELLREVNTIGSKSQLAALTQAVVEAKSVIEKFREQVQNIE